MILIPVIDQITEPGIYVLHTKIPVSESVAKAGNGALSFALSISGWTSSVVGIEQDADGRGTSISIRLGPKADASPEARLSPIQVNAIIAGALAVAIGFAVDRIYRALDSPTITIGFYVVLFLGLFFVWKKFGKAF